jgi:hypothetical protein
MLSDISYSSFSNQGESEALSDKKDLTCNSEGEMIGVSYIYHGYVLDVMYMEGSLLKRLIQMYNFLNIHT